MSIRLKCPNGHVLNVNEKLAGKTGLCPVCKARVQVPQRKPDDLEDAILGMMAAPVPPSQRSNGADPAAQPGKYAYSGDRDAAAVPKKTCHKCHHEIAATIHICPHCHTYIAKITDF